ncbi:MAG: hypothetical protein RBQ94_05455 [Methanimicrococcus sp.]|nr:hypothetical protein [Methanimicrococcus sp.]
MKGIHIQNKDLSGIHFNSAHADGIHVGVLLKQQEAKLLFYQGI